MEKDKTMPGFHLDPADNGGWVVTVDNQSPMRRPSPIAAFSNDAEMIKGLDDLIAERRGDVAAYAEQPLQPVRPLPKLGDVGIYNETFTIPSRS